MIRTHSSSSIATCAVLWLAGSAAVRAAQAGPTYASDIEPILQRQCVGCHRTGDIAPFSLESYDDARSRGRAIADATARRYMPPWKPAAGYGGPFVGARGLTDDEIGTIAKWVESGMPRGEGSPAQPERLAEWRLGPPDLVVTLDNPYILAGDGPDIFRNFAIPVPLAGEKYVAAVDFSPGGRAIHHVNIRFDQSAASRERDAEDRTPGYDGAISMSARYPDGYFLGWTPGQSPLRSAPGMAWRLAPGTDLVLQMHLRRTGKPEEIRPRVAFYFTAEAPTRTPLALRLGKQNIDIAPGEQYLIADAYQLPVDVELLAIHPHAHYRAREIRATADLPDGTRRWLLRIDDWDFNWQDVYRFAAPVALPKGTTIRMLFSYDNSETNPRNPDRPPRRVIFGQNSTDEMGDLWLQVVTATDADRVALFNDVRPKTLVEDADGYAMLVAANPDNAGYHNDLAFVSALLGRFDDAIEHYGAAARLKPDWAAAQYNVATLLATRGRLEEAVEYFRKAVTQRPTHAETHNNLGAVLQALGRSDEALEHFRRAVALDPGNAQAKANLEKLEKK
jgi:tetratricopeptide (TPR) repeat protein/mono/diheme cytochrome c family protein